MDFLKKCEISESHNFSSEGKRNKFTFHFILPEVLLRILMEMVGGFWGWCFLFGFNKIEIIIGILDNRLHFDRCLDGGISFW